MTQQRHLHRLALAVFFLNASACGGLQHQQAVPALLDTPSQLNINAIKELLHKITKQRDLKLTDTIFQNTSIVGFERKDLTGMVMDRPTRFQLMKHGDRCFLRKIGDDAVWPLPDVSCKVEKSSSY